MKQICSSAPKPLKIFSVIVILVASCSCLQAQSYIDAAKAAEVDQGRIERARALMAAHQLDTAATELESVRAATKEATLRNVTSIMLMSVYLEEGNYTRAEALLDESFQTDSVRNEESLRTYFALAGQAILGARSHLARYRNFGINISDANLQTEAATDLNRLRSFIERMAVQAKTIASDRKAYDSLSLLEDVIGLRVSLATDTEDQSKWSAEYSGVREVLASSQTQVASLGAMPVLPLKSPASTPASATNSKANAAAALPKESNHIVESSPASTQLKQPESQTNAVPATVEDTAKPVDKGPLNLIASKRVVPQYPNVARQMGMQGMVRVYVVIDEKGRVVAVAKSDGPSVLRTAAEAAARQWIFAPSSSDGHPVRATGYIDFNFTL